MNIIIKQKINTHLLAFYATGTEGVVWSICKSKSEYDGLHSLIDGDEIIIYSQDKSEVVWRGVIQLEYERLYQPYPLNPQYGQQSINNFWVNGFQVGVDPHIWANWFFDEFPAVLRNKI